ncbi:MAG: hypothetical protein ACK4N1_14515 [Pseudorhizobium sp.]
MDNFQRLLESPFRWLAGVPERVTRRFAGELCSSMRRRHQQALRRKYMNG